MKTLTILDPTSLFGRAATTAIAQELPDVRRRLFHSGAPGDHLIAEVAGEGALVPPLADPDELVGSSVVIVTAPPPPATAERLLAWLHAHPEVALVDCTQPGIAGTAARCVADAVPAAPGDGRWFHLADPALAAPLRFLAALAPFAPRTLHLTVVCPVAPLGLEALDELASQGAARLSGMPPHGLDRLPAMLAFNLAPASHERTARLEAQLAELHPDLESTVHAIDAGVFHGDLATVVVTCGEPPSRERVRAAVRAAAGVRLTRRNEVATVSDAVEGTSAVICGDLRVRGATVSAWLLADAGAVAGATAVAELVRDLSAR